MTRFFRSERGLTLAELIIAAFLIGVGVIVSAGAFNSIYKAIQSSKGHTLAANLAQEKMQVLMQKSYYSILTTTAPSFNTTYNPPLPYDPTYFAPETMHEGGMSFTRYTYVQVVQENSGAIQVLPADTPDTGMRQITVYVTWNSVTGPLYTQLQNVINNPNTVMSSAIMRGRVTDANNGNGIVSALVTAAENLGWRDSSDSSGNYSMNLSPGTFNFIASASGYFPRYLPLSISPNQTMTQNFTLVPVSTGTLTGTAWVVDHVVLSQVVASSVTPTSDQEYIELYNPTSQPVPMGVGSPLFGPYWSNWKSFFYYYDTSGNASFTYMTYISSVIPSNGYYLIANTPTVLIGGVVRVADATYGPPSYSYRNGSSGQDFSSPQHMIHSGQSGGLMFYLNNGSYWQVTDRMGWTNSGAGQPAPNGLPEPYGGTGVVSANGLVPGEQFVRKTDTGTVNASYGRAYDSNVNAQDFIDYPSIVYPPNNTSITQIPVTGTPADGAIVSVNDGYSSSVRATLTGSPAYAQFSVPGVATGTWSAFVDSGALSSQIDNIVVAGTATIGVPNAATSPSWIIPNTNATVIASLRLNGMISGQVTDADGLIISPSIVISAGGVSVTANASGRYSVRLPTGTYDITANPNNTNAAYASATQPAVSLSLVDVTATVDFNLSQGGRISGWVTRDGINPLPGVAVIAQDANGITQDTEVSTANGAFTLLNITTGTYTVSPVLDPKEAASPTQNSVTVTPGATVTVGTFTVTGAMGTLSGSVTSGGSAIQTGVLVVVSTATISGALPKISSGTLNGAVYYSASSLEDGSYSMQVRGSTTTVYRAQAYYMKLNGNTPLISTQTVNNLTITSGQANSGVNFAW